MTLRTCFQKEAGLAYFSALAASYNEIPVIQVRKNVQHYYNYYLMWKELLNHLNHSGDCICNLL